MISLSWKEDFFVSKDLISFSQKVGSLFLRGLSGGDKLVLKGVSLLQGVGGGLLFLGGDILVLRVWGCNHLSLEESLFACFIIIIMSPGFATCRFKINSPHITRR